MTSHFKILWITSSNQCNVLQILFFYYYIHSLLFLLYLLSVKVAINIQTTPNLNTQAPSTHITIATVFASALCVGLIIVVGVVAGMERRRNQLATSPPSASEQLLAWFSDPLCNKWRDRHCRVDVKPVPRVTGVRCAVGYYCPRAFIPVLRESF